METQKRFGIINYLVVLFAFSLLPSCEQLAPMEEPIAVLEEFQDLSGLALEPEDDPINARLVYTSDCKSDCIEAGSGKYFAKRDSKSNSSGVNTKKVSYWAYNMEDKFVVKVKYEITSGPSKAKASILIQINGKRKEFKAVPSGYTATFSIPLKKGWEKCDEVTFSIVQKGLGTPISFSHDYDLIPVCSEGLKIGMQYQGGIIAYILQPGDPGYDAKVIHGIIAAPSDQGIAEWWNGILTTITTGTALGTGRANTTAIVNSQGAGSYAAQICNDLVLGGYDDWYLPSKDELKKLYLNRKAVGGFVSDFYWSSSVVNNLGAWIQNLDDGEQMVSSKYWEAYVRAVRSF